MVPSDLVAPTREWVGQTKQSPMEMTNMKLAQQSRWGKILPGSILGDNASTARTIPLKQTKRATTYIRDDYLPGVVLPIISKPKLSYQRSSLRF